MSEPAQEKWFSQTIHTYKPYWLSWVVTRIYEAHFECHDILMLGESPIKWRQCPEMTIAVDWDVKHQFKQTNNKVPCIGHLQHCSIPSKTWLIVSSALPLSLVWGNTWLQMTGALYCCINTNVTWHVLLIVLIMELKLLMHCNCYHDPQRSMPCSFLAHLSRQAHKVSL